jgi:hypothetical protein
MDITYRVLGTDGKEYGPVTQPQLQLWITEGRILGESQVSRSDDGPWRQAGQFAELKWPGTITITPQTRAARPEFATAPTVNPGIRAGLERQVRGGASWFYWIAGLTAVNAVLASSGGFFVIGLQITLELGTGPIALAIEAVAIGLLVLFGVFAHQAHLWAFILGMALYGLDAAFALLAHNWLGLVFHVLALWFLFTGVKAASALRTIQRGA